MLVSDIQFSKQLSIVSLIPHLSHMLYEETEYILLYVLFSDLLQYSMVLKQNIFLFEKLNHRVHFLEMFQLFHISEYIALLTSAILLNLYMNSLYYCLQTTNYNLQTVI